MGADKDAGKRRKTLQVARRVHLCCCGLAGSRSVGAEPGRAGRGRISGGTRRIPAHAEGAGALSSPGGRGRRRDPARHQETRGTRRALCRRSASDSFAAAGRGSSRKARFPRIRTCMGRAGNRRQAISNPSRARTRRPARQSDARATEHAAQLPRSPARTGAGALAADSLRSLPPGHRAEPARIPAAGLQSRAQARSRR